MDDRPRKDRLIQTRVPQDLESTLKDEARKRRLSVSHLIRNVLEDTFSLVDNVVTEVDRVVTDSVEMAQTLKRDAQRLAATARGHTAHRDRRPEADRTATAEPAVVEEPRKADPHSGPTDPTAAVQGQSERPGEALNGVDPTAGTMAADRPDLLSRAGSDTVGGAHGVSPSLHSGPRGPLADVYGFQELVLNRSATCANCGTVIARGARAYLGMADKPGLPRVWVCQDCLETISE